MNTTVAKESFWAPGKFPIGLLVGIFVLIGILFIPTPEGLSIAGHRILAILMFAVIVWISEAVSYEVSSIMILALIVFLVGTAPSLNNAETLWGTSAAMNLALTGFGNSALALVTAALFLAACMTFTGLDKRIALNTMSLVGTSTKSIFIGTVMVTIVLSLVVPSATARGAAMLPIVLGIIASFGVVKRSNLAAGLMIVVAQGISIWNIGIQTAAAQNLLTVGFMEKMLGERVAWLDWLVAALPWSIIMSLVLIIVVLKLLPPELDGLQGGKETVNRQIAELGPMSSAQKRLLIVTMGLIAFWATEGKLHNYNTTATTTVALALLMTPKIGVITWKDIQSRVPWGTVIVFGVGISLGTAILQTQAGQWLGAQIVDKTGIDSFGPVMIFAVLSAFLILIHLGFASATALSSSMIPIMITLLQNIPGDINRLGMTMVLGFVVSYGFILPVNAPQNMVCLGTETFDAKQFARVGIVITIIAYLLMLLFASTYWKWLGVL